MFVEKYDLYVFACISEKGNNNNFSYSIHPNENEDLFVLTVHYIEHKKISLCNKGRK